MSTAERRSRSQLRSVRFSEQEDELIEQRAGRLGLYPHGYTKALLRFALGLPIPARVEAEIRGNLAVP